MIPELITAIVCVVLLCGVGISVVKLIHKEKSRNYLSDAYEPVHSFYPWKNHK